MSAAPAYVVRAARAEDAAAFRVLRDEAGAGFTSLAVDDRTLDSRVEHSAASFYASVEKPGPERYWLLLEHIESGEIAGLVGLKACVGASPPFFNFRILKIAQASVAAKRRFDLEVLLLVNEYENCTEVGSLFVRSRHRGAGIGRFLAQARYMFMAAHRSRFAEIVVSELRGIVGPDGVSPFWEHLGRHFFRMDFQEADRLSAITDNQFILDLMPKYPIYADLLPEAARAVIGRCHPQGEAALKFLLWEGFRYDRVVDIFDAGPLVSAARDSIRTLRECRALTIRATDRPVDQKAILAAGPEAPAFRCVPTAITVEGEIAHAPAGVLKALGVGDGAPIYAWVRESQVKSDAR